VAAAFAFALGGCLLGLLSLKAVAENSEGKRLGWSVLAVFGIGVSAVCGSQVTGVASISYFGNNGLIGPGAFLREIPVALIAVVIALAAVRAGGGGPVGAVLGGLFIGGGTVLAHVLLLTGMVNPTFDPNTGRLLLSAGIATVLAATALGLTSLKARAGAVLAPILLAVGIVAAERIDMSALTINADAPSLVESTPTALNGIACGEMLEPLLGVAAVSAIALFFVAMQGAPGAGERKRSMGSV
jgi:hypothetical protein